MLRISIVWRSLLVAGLLAGSSCERSEGNKDATVQRARSADSAQPRGDQTMSIQITSTAFKPNTAIPTRFTGEGTDVSPPLSWTGVPASAQQLALVCDDPDAPSHEPWVHWVIYRIPASATGLAEGLPGTEHPTPGSDIAHGVNSWQRLGYGGPMPPVGHGLHHYHFRLYALDRSLDLKPGLSKSELLEAMEGHVLAEGS